MKKSSSARVRLAIIGTGGMGGNHARQFAKIKSCNVVAAMDIDSERVATFCKENQIPGAYTRLDEMLDRESIDAVTIVTPDPLHKPLSLQCLKAGKHVLCEKPLALNHTDAVEMAHMARKTGVVNMVNFSYRDWPALQGLARTVSEGKLGDIRHFEASYLQAWLASDCWGDWRTQPTWLWRLSTSHGSKGVLGDVGVHILDATTFAAGSIARIQCTLKTFPKAKGNRIGKYKLDANDSAVMTAELTNGALGVVHTTRWCGGHANRLFIKISGTRGTVCMDSDLSTTGFRICAGKDLSSNTWKEVSCKPHPNNYAKFIQSIRTGVHHDPDFQRGAEVQGYLDACFESDSQQRPVVIPPARGGKKSL
ncbi:MAG: Gfo/Idh/MocA family protein [Candidatus Methylacidiphilales bacterium]